MRRIAASTALMAALAACSGQSSGEAETKSGEDAPAAAKAAEPVETPDGVVVAEGPDAAARPYGAGDKAAGDKGAGGASATPDERAAPQAVAAPIAAPARAAPRAQSAATPRPARSTAAPATAPRARRQASTARTLAPAAGATSSAAPSPQPGASSGSGQPSAIRSGQPTAPGTRPPANNSKIIKADPN